MELVLASMWEWASEIPSGGRGGEFGWGSRAWWGLGALAAWGAANGGRKVERLFLVCWKGDGRGGDEVDVLPTFVGLFVGGSSRGG